LEAAIIIIGIFWIFGTIYQAVLIARVPRNIDQIRVLLEHQNELLRDQIRLMAAVANSVAEQDSKSKTA
jgi:hypothetical protein